MGVGYSSVSSKIKFDFRLIEQITFVLRCVHQEGESYIEEQREMTVEDVASTILQKLNEGSLNCNDLQCTWARV